MTDYAYRQALDALAGRHRDKIAAIFQIRSNYLTAAELAMVLEFHLGDDLKESFHVQGSIDDAQMLAALESLPSDKRHPRAVLDALAWYDQELSLNQRLDAVVKQGPLFQPGLERAFRKRRKDAMRKSLREMTRNHRALALAVNTLLDDLAEIDPAAELGSEVEQRLSGIHQLILLGERHARTAAVWAIKNGIAAHQISDTLVNLYVRPRQHMTDLLTRLDTELQLAKNDRCADAVSRGVRRLALELMDATDAAAKLSSSADEDKAIRTA